MYCINCQSKLDQPRQPGLLPIVPADGFCSLSCERQFNKMSAEARWVWLCDHKRWLQTKKGDA